MAAPGSKPKPTVLKVLEGNPGKRPLNINEPVPDPTRPACPSWLRKEAKREWMRITPQLHAMGVLTKIDREALAVYCQTHAKWKEAEEFIAKHGMTYQFPRKDEDGHVVSIYVAQWPQVSIARACADQIRAMCTEFGMTPSARARMVVPGKTDTEDPIEQILNSKRNN